MDFWRREYQLDDLLSGITERRLDDKDGLRNLAGKLAYFLAGDPLSDQQAGSIARYLELEKTKPSTRLKFEERKRLVVGDWGEIERILTANEMRASLRESVKKKMAESQEQVRVYRMMEPTEDNLRYILERTLLCKANVLLETWVETGEFGISEQYRLGISTTTKENLENVRRFGSHILEITVPQDRLIATAQYDPVSRSEDERTILYYVSPERIKFC